MTRLALFDCDGTLVDSQSAIASAMDATFAAACLPPPEPDRVRRVIGLEPDSQVAGGTSGEGERKLAFDP